MKKKKKKTDLFYGLMLALMIIFLPIFHIGMEKQKANIEKNNINIESQHNCP